jgi:hypothetical protein
MPSERIVPAKGLVLGANRAMHLLLTGVMNGVFVAGEVVRTGEDGVARLAGRRIDSFALWKQLAFVWGNPSPGLENCTYLVGTRLRIALRH